MAWIYDRASKEVLAFDRTFHFQLYRASEAGVGIGYEDGDPVAAIGSTAFHPGGFDALNAAFKNGSKGIAFGPEILVLANDRGLSYVVLSNLGLWDHFLDDLEPVELADTLAVYTAMLQGDYPAAEERAESLASSTANDHIRMLPNLVRFERELSLAGTDRGSEHIANAINEATILNDSHKLLSIRAYLDLLRDHTNAQTCPHYSDVTLKFLLENRDVLEHIGVSYTAVDKLCQPAED